MLLRIGVCCCKGTTFLGLGRGDLPHGGDHLAAKAWVAKTSLTGPLFLDIPPVVFPRQMVPYPPSSSPVFAFIRHLYVFPIDIDTGM
jgi:hypothetical protein